MANAHGKKRIFSVQANFVRDIEIHAVNTENQLRLWMMTWATSSGRGLIIVAHLYSNQSRFFCAPLHLLGSMMGTEGVSLKTLHMYAIIVSLCTPCQMYMYMSYIYYNCKCVYLGYPGCLCRYQYQDSKPFCGFLERTFDKQLRRNFYNCAESIFGACYKCEIWVHQRVVQNYTLIMHSTKS